MKTLNLILIAVLCVMTSCHAQDKNEAGKQLSAKTPQNSASLSEPDVRVNVNKKYDEKGNIMSYDSTYSYSYSGKGTADFFTQYKKFFFDLPSDGGLFSPGSFDFPYMDPFLKDSTSGTFLDEHTIEKQIERNRKMMEDMFKQFKADPKKEMQDRQNSALLHRTI